VTTLNAARQESGFTSRYTAWLLGFRRLEPDVVQFARQRN
jgi:hypothetical protein